MIEEEEKVEIIIEEVEEKTNEEEEIKEPKIEEPTKGNNYSYYSYSSYSYYDNNQYYSYSEYSNSDNNDLTLTMSMNRKKKIIYVDRRTIISKVDKNKRKKMDSMRKKERQPKV